MNEQNNAVAEDQAQDLPVEVDGGAPLTDEEIAQMAEDAGMNEIIQSAAKASESQKFNAIMKSFWDGNTMAALGQVINMCGLDEFGNLRPAGFGLDEAGLYVHAEDGMATVTLKGAIHIDEEHFIANLETFDAMCEQMAALEEQDAIDNINNIVTNIMNSRRCGAMSNQQKEGAIDAILWHSVLTYKAEQGELGEVGEAIYNAMYAPIEGEPGAVMGQVVIHEHPNTGAAAYYMREYVTTEVKIETTEEGGKQYAFYTTFTNTIEPIDVKSAGWIIAEEDDFDVAVTQAMNTTITTGDCVYGDVELVCPVNGPVVKQLVTGFTGNKPNYFLVEFVDIEGGLDEEVYDIVDVDAEGVIHTVPVMVLVNDWFISSALERAIGWAPTESIHEKYTHRLETNTWEHEGTTHTAAGITIEAKETVALPGSDAEYGVNFRGSFRTEGEIRGFGMLLHLPKM